MFGNITGGLVIAYIIGIFLLFVGWIMNFYKLVTTFDAIGVPEFIVRLVGIPVFPLGGIFGFF